MTILRRLLIANRGEIARRIIRTAHRMGMETVAVHSDADADAMHVREATAVQALGGSASADSYLRIDKLIAAARASGADAVHPGYGFLSENAQFAQAVTDAGLKWVGPPPGAIRTLGNKAAAKQLAQSLGVPCLPGYHGQEQSDAGLALEASRIGFPLMVKAAAGGGGRGMRLVTDAQQLSAALHSARSEAQSAFGSGELLLERALLRPRHVEVQVFADSHGNCIHLGERDCSVQRRHQKIIEETPSPAVNEALRRRMGECAVKLAKAAGYVGAGTVEFLVEQVDSQSRGGGNQEHSKTDALGPRLRGDAIDFFLMEMNTRLQVEHPVTEMVTGIDLVEWQLRIARGEPLPLTQEQVRFEGHAIEVRLCAEDDEFRPHSGTVAHFLPPPSGEGWGGGPATGSGRTRIRFDHSIFAGQHVSPHYDSMLGKLVSHAPTREQAIDQLLASLNSLQLLGLPTNRALLAACLDHPQFRSGDALVPFLAEQGEAIRARLRGKEQQAVVGAALAALFPQARGQGLACPFPRPLRLRHRGNLLALRVRELGGGQLEVEAADGTQILRPPNAAAVRIGQGRWHVQSGAVDLLIDDASFEPANAGSVTGTSADLRAPFNGRVIAVKASPGASVGQGDTLLVLESMKLEHVLAATRHAVVQAVHVAAGQQVATGQVLVSFAAGPLAP